mgnify:CR=1 FL=1
MAEFQPSFLFLKKMMIALMIAAKNKTVSVNKAPTITSSASVVVGNKPIAHNQNNTLSKSEKLIARPYLDLLTDQKIDKRYKNVRLEIIVILFLFR